jgi:hypothetical protein
MKKASSYFPSEGDIVNVHECIYVVNVAFSLEKCAGGYHIVKYNVDKGGSCLKDTISYKRKDTKKKDTPSNRELYSSQVDAEQEMFKLYKLTSEYYGLNK